MTLQIRCTVPIATTAIQRQSGDAGSEPNHDYPANTDDTIIKKGDRKFSKKLNQNLIRRCKVFKNS